MARLIALLLASAPLAASSRVLWTGDFETGDRTQWTKMFAAVPGRLDVDAAPPAPDGSRYALRTEVRPGDVAQKMYVDGTVYAALETSNRAEMVHMEELGEGDERWYRWNMLVPEGFQSHDDRTGGIVFTQWHHTGDGSPPVLFVVDSDNVSLTVCKEYGCPSPEQIWRQPLQRAHWYTLVFHVVWSAGASRGLEELWLDGAPQFSQHLPNVFPGCTNYLQAGQYRRRANTDTTVVWLDGFVEATAREDVLPAPGAPAPGAVAPASGGAADGSANGVLARGADGTTVAGAGGAADGAGTSAAAGHALPGGFVAVGEAGGCTGLGTGLAGAPLLLGMLAGRRRGAGRR